MRNQVYDALTDPRKCRISNFPTIMLDHLQFGAEGSQCLLSIDRLKHQTKLFVGRRLEKYLSRQYWRGKGPASRLISAFSEQAKQIGVEQRILVTPVPLKKSDARLFLKR